MTDLPFPRNAEYLSVKEVAELYRVCPKTVRRWIKAGTLPATRLGRDWRIARSDLIRSLLSEVRLTPEGDGLSIELIGELAGLLALGGPKNAESLPKEACSVTMVAGVGFVDDPTLLELKMSV